MNKLSILALCCLAMAACGKKGSRYKENQVNQPDAQSKGIATYQFGQNKISTNIYEDQVIIPNQGELNFVPAKANGESSKVQLLDKSEFVREGVTFYSVPTQFTLEKTNQLDSEVKIPGNYFFLGSYKISSTEFKFKQKLNDVGTVKVIHRNTTAEYEKETGKSKITHSDTYENTHYTLKAALNKDQNKIFFYINIQPGDLTKLAHQYQNEGRAIREYGWPLCYGVHTYRFINISGNQNGVTLRCNVELGNCSPNSQEGAFSKFNIGELLADKNAYCAVWDDEAAKPRKEYEKLGLKLFMTQEKFIEIIPASADANANTELLNQQIIFPDSDFIFQKSN